MPYIIQVIDVDSAGHKCRMDDGEIAFLPHDASCVPCQGQLLERGEDGRWVEVPGGLPHLTVERANAPAQTAANILSELISRRENIKTEMSNALEPIGRAAKDEDGDDAQV